MGHSIYPTLLGADASPRSTVCKNRGVWSGVCIKMVCCSVGSDLGLHMGDLQSKHNLEIIFFEVLFCGLNWFKGSVFYLVSDEGVIFTICD